ncbi:hypothetical protein M5K25_000211 [Dendrobium thyrsiflorum]|uniref:NAC domain-containing protein n=1 Tax=Dendrobium thyrsiflorum TaxID=117978 RepID=A0ABD0VTR9_DENTH
MDPYFPPSDFPPMPSSGAKPPSLSRNWKNIFDQEESSPTDLLLSHYPLEPEIVPFSREKLSQGADEWSHCLVGYSIGRRPFYEALLGAIKKSWKLKGSLQMLSLSDGFFLFKFACSEDMDLVWSRGVWFLLGKPFVLQKWHPKFKPKREDFSSVPIWIKIHDLPLACWNSEGISRIASKVGVPIAADSLTANKTRLTFARICVLVDSNAKYPDEIFVSLDGDVVGLKVQYEWRPSPCEHCKSLVHYSSLCPSKPKTVESAADVPKIFPPRGRSHSRQSHNLRKRTPSTYTGSTPIITSILTAVDSIRESHPTVSNPPPSDSMKTPDTNFFGQPLIYQPHSPPPAQKYSNCSTDPHLSDVIPSAKDVDQVPPASLGALNSGILEIGNSNIPNLNSPMEESSSSDVSASSSQVMAMAPGVISPYKFDVLQNYTEIDNPSSSSECANNAVKTQKPKEISQQSSVSVAVKKSARAVSFNLDMMCILETRIHPVSLQKPFFEVTHNVFPNENSCNNFDKSPSGRIWVKWNASKINFTPHHISSQLITGSITSISNSPLQLTVIYASNSSTERRELWSLISQIAPHQDVPWIIMGDFNCCWYVSEKLGGLAISQGSLVEFNNMIFDNCLRDLNTVGCSYTWFNQRSDKPIHIKLDRALVNIAWQNAYPNSYCSIQSPSCSDHCPLIIHSGIPLNSHHRFLFKNYWANIDKYWILLLKVFSNPIYGNPLSFLCNSLKQLKLDIKKEVWSNSSFINSHLDRLHMMQKEYLALLHDKPNDPLLQNSLKDINQKISDFSRTLASWVIQRAKVKWLKYGEDDLKFLYAKIRSRQGTSRAAVNLLTSLPGSDSTVVINNIIQHFQALYNSPPPSNQDVDQFPIGNGFPEHYSANITQSISEEEIPPILATNFWKAVCLSDVAAKEKISFRITSNAPIFVHWDHWCYNGKLEDMSDGHYLLHVSKPDSLIRDLILDSRWNLPESLPSSIFWHSKYALRYACYTWLALVGGMKTADVLLKRNIVVPSTCSLCNAHPESISHLFFECSYSFSILSDFMPFTKHLLFRPNILQLLEWIDGEPGFHKQVCCFAALPARADLFSFIWNTFGSRALYTVGMGGWGRLLAWLSGLIHCVRKKLWKMSNNASSKVPPGKEDQHEWYFFSHKDKKYLTGSRTNRATTTGFWKATGRDKPVYFKHKLVGMRKTLVFYKGRAPNGQKSDWILHEYRLETDECEALQEEDGWVVCRVFKKRSAVAIREENELPEESSFWYNKSMRLLPPLLKSQYTMDHFHHLQCSYKEQILQNFLPYIPQLEIHKIFNYSNVEEEEEEELQVKNDQTTVQMKDWRVLEKFVASQLSQDGLSKHPNCSNSQQVPYYI